MRLVYCILVIVMTFGNYFGKIEGYRSASALDCIGPRAAFERFLTDAQRMHLIAMLDRRFEGSNRKQVQHDVYRYLTYHLTSTQWAQIIPEIVHYEAFSRESECSPESRLLTPFHYRRLMEIIDRARRRGLSAVQVRMIAANFVSQHWYRNPEIARLLAVIRELRESTRATSIFPRVELPQFQRLSEWRLQQYIRNTPHASGKVCGYRCSIVMFMLENALLLQH